MHPVLIAPAVSSEEMFNRIEDALKLRGLAAVGEQVAITMGVPIGAGESTNLLKIHRIG